MNANYKPLTHLDLRCHRADSWLEKAAIASDSDTRFIALWIAFNAAYARELPGLHSADKGAFSQFLSQLCRLDNDKAIYQLVWQRFSGSIRILLENCYVFQPFWDCHNGLVSQSAWESDFDKANHRVKKAIEDQDTQTILRVVFERIYTLRNQIIHGGATFDGSLNREQVRDACDILSMFVPLMLRIMKANPDSDWGKPFYPPITGTDE